MTTYSIDEKSIKSAVEDMAADWVHSAMLYGERAKIAEEAYNRFRGAAELYKAITGKMAVLSLDGTVRFYERR